jgi:hypothetical protein
LRCRGSRSAKATGVQLALALANSCTGTVPMSNGRRQMRCMPPYWGERQHGCQPSPLAARLLACCATADNATPPPNAAIQHCQMQWAHTRTCSTQRLGSVPIPSLYAVAELVRLVGGTDSRSGRIEMWHDGVYGGICGTMSFDNNAASVVCKQLGRGSGGI